MPAQAAQHALGSNVITPQGTVFTITTENNQTVRRPYTSSGAFLSYSFNTWDSIVGASAEDTGLPVGSFIPPQDGKIICSDRGSDKGTCYLITNGQKAGFTSSDIFKKLGYSFGHIMSGDVSFLPSTSNIDTSTSPHNPGALINKDGTVYLIGTTGLYGIPDWATLQSWGYTSTDIVTANSADRNLPYIAMLPSRQPQYLAPLNNITPDTSSNNPTIPPSSNGPSASNPWLTLRLDHPVQTGQAAQSGQTNLSFGKAGFAAYSADITVKSIGIVGEVTQSSQSGQPFTNVKIYDSSTNTLVGQTSSFSSSDSSASGAAKHWRGTVYFNPAIVISQTSVKYLELRGDLTNSASGSLRLGIEGIDASATNTIYVRDGVTGNPFYLDGYTVPTTTPTPTPTPTSTAATQLSFTIDPASPPAANVTPGSKNVTFTIFDITAVNGNGSLSSFSIGSDGPNGQANLSNIRLYQGSTLLGTISSLSGISSGNGFPQAWGQVNFGNLIIPNTYSPTMFSIVADVSPSATGFTKLGIIGLGFGSTGSASTNLSASFLGNAMTFSTTSFQVRVGQLVKTGDGTVYLVGNGGLVGFPTLSVFNSWGFCFSDVVTANSAEASLTIVGNMPVKGTTQLPSFVPSTLPVANCATATPTLSITSPNGGEKYLKASQQSIQWTSSNVTQVNIQLYKAGAFYSNITSSGYPVNNGSYYSWSIPSTLPDGTDYQVRISDASSSTFTQSSGNFSILSPSQADTLNVTISPINPVAGQVTRGQTGVAVLATDLTNTSQQTMSVSQVTFVCQGCASTPDFSNVYLWSATQGQLASMQPTSANNGFFTFNLQTPLTIAANSKQTLVIKLDIASPGSGFTNQNFYIEFRSVVASDSNGSALIQGTPVRSNTFTIQ